MKLDPVYLQQTCQIAHFDNSNKNQRLAHDLLKLMHREHGIGLAANQAGIDLRLFVMHIGDRYFHCFNPEILGSSELEVYYPEGCLSFPGQECRIRRPESIIVRYADSRGTVTEELLSGLAARCFQHELDHLNGITMLDREK